MAVALVPVMTSIPLASNAAVRPAETSWSERGLIRSANSRTVTFEPKSTRIEASWQPVSDPPMTTEDTGQLGQIADVLVGEGEFRAGDGQPAGVAADRDDDGVTGEPPAVGDLDGVLVDEPAPDRRSAPVRHRCRRCNRSSA